MQPASLQRLAAAVSGRDERIDLAEAALLIARHEYPDLDVEGYLRMIDDMGRAARRMLAGVSEVGNRVTTFNRFMFDELGFRGSEHYQDPRNSYLNQVLDRRTGIPITLSLVYLEVGWRAGLTLEGISFPGHFLVKMPLEGGMVILDPFSRGASLGIADLQARLRQLKVAPSIADLGGLLEAASKREILARMLRNLKSIYRGQGDWGRLLAVVEHLLVLHPDQPQELRDRGLAFGELECFRAACADLARYLDLTPDAEDGGEVRERMLEWQQRAARLN